MDFIRCHWSDTELEIHHQNRKLFSINERNLGINMSNIFFGFGTESTSGDEDALSGTFPCNAPINFWISGLPTVPSHRFA